MSVTTFLVDAASCSQIKKYNAQQRATEDWAEETDR